METDTDSNIRCIDLLERIVLRFVEEHNIENEVEPFYQAVRDISDNSVNDNNYYEQREGGNNAEENLPTAELIEADTDMNLAQTEITVEDITKMRQKHLKESLIARTLITAGNKQVLVDCLTKSITDNVPIADRSKIIGPLPIVRQRILSNRTSLDPSG